LTKPVAVNTGLALPRSLWCRLTAVLQVACGRLCFGLKLAAMCLWTLCNRNVAGVDW